MPSDDLIRQGIEYFQKKEATRNKIKNKIISLYQKNEKLTLLQTRFETIKALIEHNKNKQNIKIKEIENIPEDTHQDGFSSFSHESSCRKISRYSET